MRCVVTGASGHLGSFVCAELLRRGAHVTALTRASSDVSRLRAATGDDFARLRFAHADLSDAAALRAAVAQAQPEIVFHLAWGGITAGERDAATQITRGLSGTLHLLECAHDAGCRAFVGVGSQAEYGSAARHADAFAQGDAFAELARDGRSDGFEAYGLAKLCACVLARKLCEGWGMGCVWLRLLATYGPGDDARHLIPFVIERLLRGEKPALSSGVQRWDYLFVQDAAQAICACGLKAAGFAPEREGEAAVPKGALPGGALPSGTFELGSGQAPTVRAIVERIRDLIDPSLPLGWNEIAPRAGQIMHLQADIAPLQRFIAWQPRTDLDEGLRRTIAWHHVQQYGGEAAL